eukprot:gene19674-20137_t
MTISFVQKRSTLLIAAAVTLLAGGAWTMSHRADAVAAETPLAQQAPAVAVTTTAVQERDVPLYLAGVGTVTANANAVHAINKAQLNNAKPLKVSAYTRTGNEVLATGELILVNNQIDTTSGSVQLKARFTNKQHKLWPGQYVNINLQMDDHALALTLPSAAIQRNQEGTYGYLVKADNTVALQPVKVARIQDDIAVVTDGLQQSQRVVLDGQICQVSVSATFIKRPIGTTLLAIAILLI